MDDVLRVVARLKSTAPKVRLRVLGDGPELESLRALARSLGLEGTVTFAGHVHADALVEEYRQASAFLLMSRSDRIPNVVREAMASGCPCVVTATQGMDEIVAHGHTGYLVELGDVEAASEHLRSTLFAPEQHALMVSDARDLIVERFSVDAAMSVYRRVWLEVSSKRDQLHGTVT